jgi:hypothetical protein
MSTVLGPDTRPESLEQRRTESVAVIAEKPSQLAGLVVALLRLPRDEVRDAYFLVTTNRFHAPATHPPYDRLARAEARGITQARITASEAEAREVSRLLDGTGWQTHVEVLLDATPADVANRLRDRQIGRVLAPGQSGRGALAGRAAALAGAELVLAGGASSSTPPASITSRDGGVAGLRGASQR